MMKKYILTIIAACMAIGAQAQYDQTIEVEGKYLPDIIDHDRVGRFPKAVRFGIEQTPLSYSMDGLVADFTPQAVPMPATAWRVSHEFSTYRGYLDLGLGSWLNSTASAGYRFVDNEATVFGIKLQHNSTSLWRPKMSEPVEDVKRYRYDESAGLYASHKFAGIGMLRAEADWHLGLFNYYGFNPMMKAEAPRQTMNDVSAQIGWQSPATSDKTSYSITAGVRYIGFRNMFLPNASNFATPIRETGGRETDLSLSGRALFPLTEVSSLGFELAGHMLINENVSDYGLVSLTPYYSFIINKVHLQVGAKMDFSMNAGNGLVRYPVFHIAPDVRGDFNMGAANLWMQLGGGSELHTLAGSFDKFAYHQPMIYDTTPIYSPLDAKLGLNFGPFSGFSAGIKVAFRTSFHQYYGEWYQTMLNSQSPSIVGLPGVLNGVIPTYDYSGDCNSKLTGFSVGANIGYDAGRYFKAELSGSYQPQTSKIGYATGYDRSCWLIDMTMQTNPWSSLKFMLGLNYRGARRMPVKADIESPMHEKMSEIVMYHMPDHVMLNFGASYDVTSNLNIWLQADNLLNRRNMLAPSLPEPGICIYGGVSLKF